MARFSLLGVLVLAGLAVTADAHAERATQVIAGGSTTCAVVESAEVACWGSNHAGALGRGINAADLPRSGEPARVVTVDGPLRSVRQVSLAAGATWPRGCAVSDAGSVWCWGSNIDGALGQPADALSDSQLALAVSFDADMDGVVQVATGGRHSCALHGSGRVSCWGAGVVNGRGDSSHAPAWVRMADGATLLDDVAQIAAGSAFTCARRHGGTVHCWGFNHYAELANGFIVDDSRFALPAREEGGGIFSTAVDLVAGEAHACVNDLGGYMHCWGRNAVGPGLSGTTTGTGDTQAGLFPLISRAARTHVGNGNSVLVEDVRAMTAGAYHSCASSGPLADMDGVLCTGANSHGQIGALLVPVGQAGAYMTSVLSAPLLPLVDIVQLAAGERHTCGLETGGRVLCWGRNHAGQLGRGSIGSASEAFPWPMQVLDLDGQPVDPIFANGMEMDLL